MAEPIRSPDGKFMWSGDEWIPTPPNDQGNQINMQDSVIGGDVISNTTINNDPSAVTSAVITALQQMGMITTPQPQSPPVHEVELPKSFDIGDHVEYHSPTNQRWLNRCKVVAINDDGTYKVEVPKQNQIETKHAVVIGTSPGTIRPASIPFEIGDRVFVNWKNYGHYYAGKITKENSDFTFMIHFDDGDVEDNVEWERIEPLNEESKEVQEYINHDSEAEKELIEAFEVFDDNNTGTIPAREYMRILTESGDDPIPVDEVMDQFNELGIQLDSQIDYRELAKYLVGSQMMENAEAVKPEVVIRDAEIVDGKLKGYAYAHPKLGETWINSSSIEGITFDERATSRVETRNTIYVVGPTGWLKKPENHPFNQPTFNTGQQVKVEWNGSWWDAIIREIRGDNSDGNLFLIHYVGFDSSWDEWIDISRIKNA
ncbi:MAG: hypothetical protein H2066_02915 [Candidatus Poseidoniales archaeon]|nr:hypothetical protein [Candidatus Poseidoniales archaeon]